MATRIQPRDDKILGRDGPWTAWHRFGQGSRETVTETWQYRGRFEETSNLAWIELSSHEKRPCQRRLLGEDVDARKHEGLWRNAKRWEEIEAWDAKRMGARNPEVALRKEENWGLEEVKGFRFGVISDHYRQLLPQSVSSLQEWVSSWKHPAMRQLWDTISTEEIVALPLRLILVLQLMTILTYL